MNPVVNALIYLAIGIILLFGSVQVKTGTATPGTIMAAITYSTQMLNGILMLVMLFQNISRGYASWKRVKEILDSSPELKDSTFDGDTECKGEIEFRDVSFSYPDSKKTVLEHVNLKINKGETVVIMGATGCGKTSLINLIPRFYDVSNGTILVDSIDIKEYKQKNLRKKLQLYFKKVSCSAYRFVRI